MSLTPVAVKDLLAALHKGKRNRQNARKENQGRRRSVVEVGVKKERRKLMSWALIQIVINPRKREAKGNQNRRRERSQRHMMMACQLSRR